MAARKAGGRYTRFVNPRFTGVRSDLGSCMVYVRSLGTVAPSRLWRVSMAAFSARVVAVVDDDPSVLEALSNLLNSAGYVVAPFESAESFLAGCAVGACDCLISDIGLPGMNGIELQVAVGIREPNLPVILITGRDDYRFRPVNASNNHGLFHKPFDAEKLLAAIAGAINPSIR
jgi:FixJ family two-component response regulator